MGEIKFGLPSCGIGHSHLLVDLGLVGEALLNRCDIRYGVVELDWLVGLEA